jgi:luciferase family oxidoreductase group 1
MKDITLSVLELAVVRDGGTTREAIDTTVAVAQHAEQLGYKRVWLAEHHNMEHIASSATSVLIGHVAGETNSIRVGSGGIMLPNHSPLVIAEQFGTLETLYPGRIDLGLGRAPGTDQLTAMALRRNNMASQHNFPAEVRELLAYFENEDTDTKVRAFPGEGLQVPVWILGSSTDSAHLAAEMGLPYAFAAHFAPAQFATAIDIYRKNFRPSKYLSAPYVMACVNVIGADTDAEAEHLVTSLYRMFMNIITNNRSGLKPPGELPPLFWHPDVQQHVKNMTACTFTGNKESLRRKLAYFIEETGVDELMVATYIYDKAAKLKSFSILMDAVRGIE